IAQNEDPRKELPIASVVVTASDGASLTRTKSDTNGFFAFSFRKRLLRLHPVIMLTFSHADYESLEMTAKPGGDITIAKLVSNKPLEPANNAAPKQTIGNVTVRYSIKSSNVATVGSAVRSFEVPNAGNVPCNSRSPCSPDGKWKAATGNTLLEAGA